MNQPIRTALYVPGSSAKMLAKSRDLAADAIIFDLEDAVSPDEKDAARGLVVEELRGAASHERWVRINAVGSPEQVADLDALLAVHPDALVLPKAELSSLAILEQQLAAQEALTGLETPAVVALIETARGLLEVGTLAVSARRLVALQLGAEDLTADLGTTRTAGGEEILFARHQLVLAAKAFGLQVLDTPNTTLLDDDALAADCATARRTGFTGKTCIHPRQLPVVDAAFRPTADEVAHAERVIAAFDEALTDGRGACQLDGKMIDAPIAARARRLLDSQS